MRTKLCTNTDVTCNKLRRASGTQLRNSGDDDDHDNDDDDSNNIIFGTLSVPSERKSLLKRLWACRKTT